jgi:hypothetical protein
MIRVDTLTSRRKSATSPCAKNGFCRFQHQMWVNRSLDAPQQTLDLRHIVVLDRCCVTVIPVNSDRTPTRLDNGSKIGGASLPANAVASFEESGLVAGH